MNTSTGEIISNSEYNSLPPKEMKNFIQMGRDTTAIERYHKQVLLYAPCGCGSGKKFKFCCLKTS